jgi:hypothetical protein
MDTLGIEYFLFVVAACLGVVQLAAANAGLSGLLFFRQRRWAVTFGFAATTWAFWWFFSMGDRSQIGLAGAELFTGFSLGVLTAVALTLLISSVARAGAYLRSAGGSHTCSSHDDPRGEGLDVLKNQTYLQTIRHWRASRKDYAEVVKR